MVSVRDRDIKSSLGAHSLTLQCASQLELSLTQHLETR